MLTGLVGIGVAASALAAPILAQVAGLQGALIITGLLLPACALLGYRAVRRSEGAAVIPERKLALMREIPMFAPLPFTALEYVARALEPVAFEVGERVITQGERGDCYCLIASGTVEIVHEGHRETTLGAGHGFGEIALLSDRPRTATVQVVDRLAGYRLGRDAFLEAVTGSPNSVLAADELVARRLTELAH